MYQSEWTYKSAAEMSAALHAGTVSATELAHDAIRRIESVDPMVNAVCVPDFDRALEAAGVADAALRRGDRRALLGIPMLVKESYNIAGLATTWGRPQFRDFVAGEDALAVARVKQAGGIVLGKTNVPVGLRDWQSYNPLYGTTCNPFDLSRSPGGSSGGSSAALASGYAPLALGSDIGGSLRIPAHLCGVYAHKPSLGIIPSRGHTPPPAPALPEVPDLGVIGPMARSADDLSLLFDTMIGPDERDTGIAYRLELPKPRHERLKDYRILFLETNALIPTGPAVAEQIQSLASALVSEGAMLHRQSEWLPDVEETARVYMRMLMSFFAGNMPSEIYECLSRQATHLPAEHLSLAQERLKGCALSHRDWLAENKKRARLRADWGKLFTQFDVVICPVLPIAAFPHDHVPFDERIIEIGGMRYPFADQLLWSGIATLLGLPATAIPIGMTKTGLPVGVQIIGPWLEDRTPLFLARLIEKAFGGFVAPCLEQTTHEWRNSINTLRTKSDTSAYTHKKTQEA